MQLTFLYKIPAPLDWTTDQVANVISLLGATATVWALIYAIRQGVKNSKKINDLAEITNQLATQNKLMQEQNIITKIQLKETALPVPKLESFTTEDRGFRMEIKNDGNRFNVTKFEDSFEDFKYMTSGSDVLSKKTYIIYATKKVEKKTEECKFNILIEYSDIYGNLYSFRIGGNGQTWTSHNDVPISLSKPQE
jgi:hypothetical protein